MVTEDNASIRKPEPGKAINRDSVELSAFYILLPAQWNYFRLSEANPILLPKPVRLNMTTQLIDNTSIRIEAILKHIVGFIDRNLYIYQHGRTILSKYTEEPLCIQII